MLDCNVVLHNVGNSSFGPWGKFLWLLVEGQVGMVCVDYSLVAKK